MGHLANRGVNASTIHQMGLSQVAELKKQAEQSAMDHGNLTFAELAQFLRNSSENRFTSREETLKVFKAEYDTINRQLPKFFTEKTLARGVYEMEIVPVPQPYVDEVPVAYVPFPRPSMYVNVDNFDIITPMEVAVTTLHEANPGNRGAHLNRDMTETNLRVPGRHEQNQ